MKSDEISWNDASEFKIWIYSLVEKSKLEKQIGEDLQKAIDYYGKDLVKKIWKEIKNKKEKG